MLPRPANQRAARMGQGVAGGIAYLNYAAHYTHAWIVDIHEVVVSSYLDEDRLSAKNAHGATES